MGTGPGWGPRGVCAGADRGVGQAAAVAGGGVGAVRSRWGAAGGWQGGGVPPRALAPARAGRAWDLLAALARRAAHGWRAAAPPVAFEVHAVGGELTAGLWLPGGGPPGAGGRFPRPGGPGGPLRPGPPPRLPP